MNYNRIYKELIDRAINRKIDDITEEHHILPKCMGGSDDKENLVRLTPEEHYLAHQLLIRIYPNNHKLVYAARMMIVNRPSNKLYGWLKRRHIKVVSERQSGDGNSQFGTRWIHNDTLKVSKKLDKNAVLPEGWCEGRVINFDKKTNKKVKEKRKKERTKKQILNSIKSKHYRIRNSEWYRKSKSKKLYSMFVESGLSLRSFAKSKDMVPMTLSNMFREFIPEYNATPRVNASKQFT